MLFLRADNIQDEDVKQIAQILKPDPLNPLSLKPLKVLDLSYNPITKDSIHYLSEMLEVNRTLEYIGLAKCKLQTAQAVKLFEQIGRLPFPQEQAEPHQGKLKARDAILEKNKKLKASKKPEEPVPQLDMIEQGSYLNNEGVEVQGWMLLKNMQFKHINLCANDINLDCREAVVALLRRTNDDFGLTLAGNNLNKAVGDSLVKVAQDVHLARVGADNADVQMGLRRVAL